MTARVVHSVARWLPPSQAWLYDQLRFLPGPAAGVVVCGGLDEPARFPGPKVLCAPWPRQTLDRVLRKRGFNRPFAFLERTARERGARVLHSHFGWTGWLDSPTARRAGLKHVVSFYGADMSLPRRQPRWGPRYRELFAAADAFLCEGPFMGARLAELGCPPRKIRLQRLGVDLESIPFAPRVWRPGEPLKVLMAAAFRETKGLPCGIAALGLIFGKAPLELTIIGAILPGHGTRREERRIREAIARHLPGASVRLPGFVARERLREEALAHHLFLCPSQTGEDGDSEGGLPTTLLELAATGLPVVATRHCDIPEAVILGETGWLAEERDAAGLAEGVERLLARPGDWAAMGARARALIAARFDARAQAEHLAAFYAGLS